jgi:hypothetical protein
VPCISVEIYGRFRVGYYLHHQGYTTSVSTTLHGATLQNSPHTRRLKSHIYFIELCSRVGDRYIDLKHLSWKYWRDHLRDMFVDRRIILKKWGLERWTTLMLLRAGSNEGFCDLLNDSHFLQKDLALRSQLPKGLIKTYGPLASR